jgi:hypothetical protein
MEQEKITFADGKYTILIKQTGGLECLRYGEPWRDLTGDGMVYSLACALSEARDTIEELKSQIRLASGGDK